MLNQTHSVLLRFQDLNLKSQNSLEQVGGKAANLGALSRVTGIQVPDGFCVSTDVYQAVVAQTPAVQALLQQLAVLKVQDRKQIAELSAELRRVIEALVIPAKTVQDICQLLSDLGEQDAYAVRSSATAEDLPNASFAGQQDTYLNIIGQAEILKHICKCWASLFTERAIIYRLQNNFEHQQVKLSVIVQKMVFPEASGVLFTADPLTSNRKVLAINASYGLGEALVSGLVSADTYKVRNSQIIETLIADKKLAIYSLPAGGTQTIQLEPEQQKSQTLTEAQILELAQIGRQIEAVFGTPQDIEWCLADDQFYILQSRPITTLFPIPGSEQTSQENRVYLSVGHQQMMTDPMRPLGLSMYQLLAGAPMFQAGGRLFVDSTAFLQVPARRKMLLNVMSQSEPLMQNALNSLLERGDFIQTLSEAATPANPRLNTAEKLAQSAPPEELETDPDLIINLIQITQASIEALKQNITHYSGVALMDFIREDVQGLKKLLGEIKSMAVIMAAMTSATWVNEKMNEWLGVKNAADVLTLSVEHNITSEMGRALLEVADVIRPYPAVINYLQTASDDFLAQLPKLDGGQKAYDAMVGYLSQYGMRGPGEVDITNPRWSEQPARLLPLILSHIQNIEPGEGKRKFEALRQQALKAEQDLLSQLESLPDGAQKVEAARQKIAQIRKFAGYREYPKYGMMSHYFVYKQAMLKEAEKLVQAGLLQDQADIYFLSFDELRDVLLTQQIDASLISQRKADYQHYQKLTPPRVITSDGEIFNGHASKGDAPEGALTGLAVSSGVVEGRARVVFKLEEAEIEEGDILITPFTDPGWTPLFVSIKALVTEVGGTMTHGAVVAREYGLPAVVSVEQATQRIQDGQRIRVNGTDGYIELL